MIARMVQGNRFIGLDILQVSHETLYWYDFPAKFASDHAVRPAAHSGVRLQASAVTRHGKDVATTTLMQDLRSMVDAADRMESVWGYLSR